MNISVCPRKGESQASRINSSRLTSVLQYCSGRCQRQHWPKHRVDCEHPFVDPKWQPNWVVEGRAPLFYRPKSRTVSPAQEIPRLWGRFPAYDCIQMGRNEGLACKDYNFKICLAGKVVLYSRSSFLLTASIQLQATFVASSRPSTLYRDTTKGNVISLSTTPTRSSSRATSSSYTSSSVLDPQSKKQPNSPHI